VGNVSVDPLSPRVYLPSKTPAPQLAGLLLRFLGLLSLEIIEVTETQGLEFYVHLRKPLHLTTLEEGAFYAGRATRLLRIASRLGTAGFGIPGPGQSARALYVRRFARRAKMALVRLVPERTYATVRAWNRKRKARRS
jgi:hypothetical protein